MDTQRLYYNDSYLCTFEATVLSCTPAKNGYAVVLDKTAFFPEGGGQPADSGTLGCAEVVDVHEKDGIITHFTNAPLQAGSTVTGALNWARRFDHMQQHTGEHILSGIVNSLYGWDNVGFHMGADVVTVDFSGPMDSAALAKAEQLANQAVYAAAPVCVSYPTARQLQAMQYRSKKEIAGQVRIVTVGTSDKCACCGTHTATAAEVGIIKILSAQNYKGGVRITMVSGGRAFADYCLKTAQANEISAALSVKPNQLTAAFTRLKEETAALKMQLAAVQTNLFAKTAALLGTKDANVCLFEDNLSPDDLRRLCLLVAQGRSGVSAVFSGSDTAGYKYALASESLDILSFGKSFHAACSGRGGGKPPLLQGSCTATKAQIEQYFAALQPI
ncbi:MAG: alanyl-tRNA editing protein [Oscillospiraceae bacterium]|nr:alanyl-tRNA editing protein [Oscillospiraceae bacterium]